MTSVGLSSVWYKGSNVLTIINYHKYAFSILMQAYRDKLRVNEIDQIII